MEIAVLKVSQYIPNSSPLKTRENGMTPSYPQLSIDIVSNQMLSF